MKFSKEDKAAWNDSEIMWHFERIAREENILDGPPPEAYLPIELDETELEPEPSWEDEEVSNDVGEDRIDNMLDEIALELESDSEEDLFKPANQLIDRLQKIAHDLAFNSKMKSALRVERAIYKIKNLIGGK